MSKLHELKVYGLVHDSPGQDDSRLRIQRPCWCPGCGKSFPSIAALVEHQDDEECGIVALK